MAKKKTLEELKEEIENCAEELSNIDKKREKKRDELKKMKERFADEERKVRTHSLCTIGGMVYSRFGDDISPDEFSEMLDFLFSLEEVKAFVESEKERRFLRNNPPPIAVSEENRSPNDSADMENPKTDNNSISDSYSDTNDDEITDEKTSA